MPKKPPCKKLKDREKRLHEALDEVVHFLSISYPTTAEFQKEFKPFMFAKKNIAAFHHVTYFLLETLDPEKVKQKITKWPLYEIRDERSFRLEVLAYINELNLTYSDANIPAVVESLFICPGGEKFIKFMLQLSQLVLREHLKSKLGEESIIHSLKSSKNEQPQENLKFLKNLTASVINGTEELKKEISCTHDIFSNEMREIEDNILHSRKKLATLQGQWESLDKTEVDFVSVRDKMNELQLRLISKQKIKDKLLKTVDCIEYLMGSKCTYEYKPKTFKLPNEDNLDSSSKGIKLKHLLEGAVLCLEMKYFEIEPFNISELESLIKKYSDSNEFLRNYTDMFKSIYAQFSKLIEIINNNMESPKLSGNDILDDPVQED